MPEPTIHPEEFKQYVTNLAFFCRRELFLGEYNLTMAWQESDHTSDDPGSSVRTFATIDMDTVYLWFKITVYPSFVEDWKSKSYKKMGEYILHELCHLLVEPIVHFFDSDVTANQRGMVRDTVERQVCRITNAIGDLLPKDWYLPEKVERVASPNRVPMVEREDA